MGSATAQAGAAFVQGLPPLGLNPDLVFALFLSPMLYAGTSRITVHLLRHNLVPGVLLGALLVVGTIAAVAVAARLLLPGLPWAGAFLLGCATGSTRRRSRSRSRSPAERKALLDLRARDRIGDEKLRETDLRERVTEESALPGAGPPNP